MPTCPYCESNYPEKAEICPKCDADLSHTEPADTDTWAKSTFSDQLGEWPVNESGEKETTALLTCMDNINMQLDALRGLLLGCGIPTYIVPQGASDIAQVYFGQSWRNRYNFEVFVPESRWNEAKEIMNAPPVYEESEEPS